MCWSIVHDFRIRLKTHVVTTEKFSFSTIIRRRITVVFRNWSRSAIIGTGYVLWSLNSGLLEFLMMVVSWSLLS